MMGAALNWFAPAALACALVSSPATAAILNGPLTYEVSGIAQYNSSFRDGKKVIDFFGIDTSSVVTFSATITFDAVEEEDGSVFGTTYQNVSTVNGVTHSGVFAGYSDGMVTSYFNRSPNGTRIHFGHPYLGRPPLADDLIGTVARVEYLQTDADITMITGLVRFEGRILSAKVVGGFSSAVPEPATWALMIVGFGAVGGAMRRRRYRTSEATLV